MGRAESKIRFLKETWDSAYLRLRLLICCEQVFERRLESTFRCRDCSWEMPKNIHWNDTMGIFSIDILSYRCRNPHYQDTTVSRPSHLLNRISMFGNASQTRILLHVFQWWITGCTATKPETEVCKATQKYGIYLLTYILNSKVV